MFEPGYGSEERLLADTVRRFLAERAPIGWVRARWGAARPIDGTRDPLWRDLVALGLPGLLVPESHGGAGGGMAAMGAVLEEMGRAMHPGPFLASALGATAALCAVGADELAGALARGDAIATLAFEDAPRGASPAPACAIAAGDRLCGAKRHVLDAAAADWLLVPAGDALWQVERTARGVRVEPEGSVDGTRPLATVRFDGAPARRLGPRTALGPALDRLFAGIAADGLGAAQAALDRAVSYAKQRHQFGVPIGSFQAVAHLLVDMLHGVELARGAVHHALWALDAEPPAVAHRAALVAKGFASEALPAVGAGAIQVLGGLGFTWEDDAHLYYKRLLTLEQAFGGAAACWDALADELLAAR